MNEPDDKPINGSTNKAMVDYLDAYTTGTQSHYKIAEENYQEYWYQLLDEATDESFRLGLACGLVASTAVMLAAVICMVVLLVAYGYLPPV